MKIIDKIYYINLDKRPDRNECNKANIPIDKIQRFKAFDGNTYNFNEYDLSLFKKADYKNKRIIGNQLSHYYILKEMVEKKL